MPKVNEARNAEMLRRHENGETLREIAADYGITHAAVSVALKRHRARTAQKETTSHDDHPLVEIARQIVRWMDGARIREEA